MIIPKGSTYKSRTIQGDAYKDAGYADFTLNIPRPFVADMFMDLQEQLKVSAHGIAISLNQLLAENLGNNMAARIRAIVKENESAKKGEPLKDLPGQQEMDEMVQRYDFSRVRAATAVESLSPLERAMYRYARQIIREILREEGTKELPPPVTVAKKEETPKEGQISYPAYGALVQDLVDGVGIWANGAPAELRETKLVAAAQALVAADEKAATTMSIKLGLVQPVSEDTKAAETAEAA